MEGGSDVRSHGNTMEGGQYDDSGSLGPFTEQYSGGSFAREKCKVAHVAGIQSCPQNDILRVEIFGHSQ